MTNTTYFSPSVIYNEKTRTYVLWMLADVIPGAPHRHEPGNPKKHSAVRKLASGFFFLLFQYFLFYSQSSILSSSILIILC